MVGQWVGGRKGGRGEVSIWASGRGSGHVVCTKTLRAVRAGSVRLIHPQHHPAACYAAALRLLVADCGFCCHSVAPDGQAAVCCRCVHWPSAGAAAATPAHPANIQHQHQQKHCCRTSVHMLSASSTKQGIVVWYTGSNDSRPMRLANR